MATAGEAVDPEEQAAFMRRLQEMLGPMLPAMRAAGVPMPEASELAMPEVYLDADVLQVASQLSDLCRGDEIYRMDREVVTIDEGSGRLEPMPPKRFVTWIGERVKFYKLGAKGKRYESMTEQMASLVLCSDRFKSRIRQVTAVHQVKMPAWGPVVEGKKTVRLLPGGYDAASRVFTVRAAGLEYAEDWPVEQGVQHLRRLLGGFPFGEMEQGMGNQISFMLSLYMRAMIAPDKLPAYVIGANLVSSGKGILAKLGICAVYGRASTTSLSKDDELRKELDVAARHGRPYLFFDDLGGTVNNRDLNAWLTSTHRSGRVIGTGETFEMPTAAMLIFTGNQLKLSPDLERRRVAVDLFAEEAAPDRPEPEEVITDEWLMDPEKREGILAAMWALVRFAYSKEGQATGKRYGKPLGSFEKWSRVVPRVCVRCGFADPLVRVVMPDSGDLSAEDGKRTLQEAIEAMRLPVGGKGILQLVDLIPYARRAGAFVERLGTVEDVMVRLDGMDRGGWKEEDWGDGYAPRKPETEPERRAQAERWVEPVRGGDRGMLSSFGYHIRKYCGRKIHTQNALGETRDYMFSDRASSRSSSFSVLRLR
jgi:hypothetical protein